MFHMSRLIEGFGLLLCDWVPRALQHAINTHVYSGYRYSRVFRVNWYLPTRFPHFSLLCATAVMHAAFAEMSHGAVVHERTFMPVACLYRHQCARQITAAVLC